MNAQRKKMTTDKQLKIESPNPEVSAKKTRRKYTARYKLKVLEQADAYKQSGELGEFLRREGLYSSNLTAWKKQREEGILQGVTPRKRGRKTVEKTPLADSLAKLEKENRRLQGKLKKAEMIIEVQKKISLILSTESEEPPERI